MELCTPANKPEQDSHVSSYYVDKQKFNYQVLRLLGELAERRVTNVVTEQRATSLLTEYKAQERNFLFIILKYSWAD